LLEKLINNADSIDEAISIRSLGLTFKNTGLYYQQKLEKKQSEMIHYLKKNDKMSFDHGGIKHKLIIGDNYHALLNLLITHKGKIDVIYIDPPYGCDSMGQFADTNYENNITRDNLLSMLEPRLRLANQLLSNEGVIFCSIDDKNQAYLKLLFDEIFGENNFIATLI
jgi:adenine-specific DNA-methyltransferase